MLIKNEAIKIVSRIILFLFFISLSFLFSQEPVRNLRGEVIGIRQGNFITQGNIPIQRRATNAYQNYDTDEDLSKTLQLLDALDKLDDMDYRKKQIEAQDFNRKSQIEAQKLDEWRSQLNWQENLIKQKQALEDAAREIDKAFESANQKDLEIENRSLAISKKEEDLKNEFKKLELQKSEHSNKEYSLNQLKIFLEEKQQSLQALQLDLDNKNSALSIKDSELTAKSENLEKKEIELNKSFIKKCKDYLNNALK